MYRVLWSCVACTGFGGSGTCHTGVSCATSAFGRPSAYASTILDRSTSAWDAVCLRNQPRSTLRS